MRTISRVAAVSAGMAAVLWSGGAAANDSTAELAAGGLVLTKSAAIEMRSEDLYISAKQVRVRYRFANTSPNDVTVTVAFPMPDITTEGVDDMLSIPTADPVNILGFATRVDGRPVTAEVEQRAVKDGVDETAYLKSLGLPLAPHLASTNAALDRLPQATRDALVGKHLAVIDEYGDSETTMQKHWEATWTLKTTYFWRQTFPARREVAVEHSYTPSVGESAGTEWGAAWFAKQPEYAARRAHYCIDDEFLAAAQKAMRPGDVSPPFTEQRIEYVLSSGANWRAPIGDFRMVVDKGAPGNVVSFCADGVKKISATEFEVRRKDFTPTRDVSIVILQPRADE